MSRLRELVQDIRMILRSANPSSKFITYFQLLDAFKEPGCSVCTRLEQGAVKALELARQFEGLSFRALPEYVTPENVGTIIRSGDVVFLGVDNHKTRRLVSDHCHGLTTVTLISGGNDYTDGNLQVYLRQAGCDITVPLTHFHPEIADPRDRSPHEMSCDELSVAAAPQLLFTNLAVASAMLNAFYAWHVGKLQYGEVYLDILEGKASPVERQPSQDFPERTL